MAKKLLKVAAGIDFVFGGLVLLFSLLIANIGFLRFLGITGIVFSGVYLVLGGAFWYISQKDNEDFIRARVYIIILSIISFFTGNVINFILGIIAYTDMPQNTFTEPTEKKELTEEEKAQKRLRNLLALGCALVLLSGIIFAMTTWETLSGFGKTVSLIIATLIFFIMSCLAERKFNLKTSAITYYILANAFSIFAFVSAGYFDVFGTWFSLNGEGAYLYSAFLWTLGAFLSYTAYLKYDIKNIFYIFNFTVLFALIYILKFYKVESDISLFIIIVTMSIFALMPKKGEIMKIINNFALIFLPISSLALFSNITAFNLGNRVIFYLLSFGVVFVSTYYLAIVNKNMFYEIFAPLFNLVTAFVFSAVLVTDNKIVFLQLLLITVIIYALGYYKKDRKELFISSAIVCDFALLYVLLDSINLGYNYYAIASGIALLGTSVIVTTSKHFGKYHFEKILEPIKVILLSYAVYTLSYKFDYTDEALFLALIGLVFAVISVFRKDLIKKLYFIGAVIAATITLLCSISEFAPASQIINVIALAILLFVTFKAEDKRFLRCKELIYGLSLFAFAVASLNTFSHFDLKLIGIILLTVVYAILFIASNKNNVFRCFTIVALLIPYVVILPISIWNDNVNYILYSLPWLALIFVYTRGFLASANLKTVNVIEVITLSIWYLAVSSEISLEVAIFIGVVSFIAILIGFRSEKWISLYYTGVAFLILNTLVQLKEFWTSIPIWAYILIAGLILIGIVTYKEYTRANGKDKIEKVDAEIVGQPKAEVIKTPVDTRTIVIGSVLYLVFIPILLEIIL